MLSLKKALDSRIESDVQEIASLLSLEPLVTHQLLTHFQWKEEKLKSSFFSNRAKTLTTIGYAEPEAKGTKKGKFSDSDCPVCFDTLEETNSLALPCGHRYCIPCWKDHLQSKVSNNTMLSAACPKSGCGMKVYARLWKDLLGDKAFGRWMDAARESYLLARLKDSKPCPFVGCTCITAWHSDVNVPVQCICGMRFCYECQDAMRGDHAPASCKDTDAWMSKFKSEADNVLWMKVHCKPCPKCRVQVEKNGGCNHHTCAKCRHEYCWLCLGDWRGHTKCERVDKDRDTDINNAKNELERYDRYLHRWTTHKKAGDIARADLQNLEALESYYSDSFEIRTQDADFLKPTLTTLMLGRSMLSWSYVREYYTHANKKLSVIERNLWDHDLGEMEMHVDRLQEKYEDGKKLEAGQVKAFLAWKESVVNLTRIAEKFFNAFCEGVLKGNLGGTGKSELELLYAVQLEELEKMGFNRSTAQLIELLEKHKGDLTRVVNILIAQ